MSFPGTKFEDELQQAGEGREINFISRIVTLRQTISVNLTGDGTVTAESVLAPSIRLVSLATVSTLLSPQLNRLATTFCKFSCSLPN